MVTPQLIESPEERPKRDVEFTVSKSAGRVILVDGRKGQKVGLGYEKRRKGKERRHTAFQHSL
jgi:hypothetical protein